MCDGYIEGDCSDGIIFKDVKCITLNFAEIWKWIYSEIVLKFSSYKTTSGHNTYVMYFAYK